MKEPTKHKDLRDLKNVGKATLQDLHLLQIETVEELAKQDPVRLFHELERLTKSRQAQSHSYLAYV